MREFVTKEGKTLRRGVTTGSCAAAAAYAAARLLFCGKAPERVKLVTPSGEELDIPVYKAEIKENKAFCSVIKDSGDDPDITNGAEICAVVTKKNTPGITVDGGEGVGRVTKKGLDRPQGSAAINSVPLKMIEKSAQTALCEANEGCGLSVIISVPEGKRLAEKTFNPRLGIEGGISILGTTGIVEPMSEQAILDTIKISLRQKRAEGKKYALLTPGNYGSDFILNTLLIDPEKHAVLVSNFIGDALTFCKDAGFSGVLLVGHIGKLCKLAGNVFNTHSKYGDCRMEIMAAHAALFGLSEKGAKEILSCVTCDDALRVLEGEGKSEKTLESLKLKIEKELAARCGDMESGAILFSKERGLLCQTSNAARLLKIIREE